MMMEKLKNIKDEYIEKRKRELQVGVVDIDVHMGTCGIAAGAKKILQSIEEELERLEVTHVRFRITGCAGLCSMEPMITVTIPGQPPVKYGKLDEKKVKEIVYSHVLGGHAKGEYAIGYGLEKPQERIKKE